MTLKNLVHIYSEANERLWIYEVCATMVAIRCNYSQFVASYVTIHIII